jgi:4-oxalocrotonate tautomerase
MPLVRISLVKGKPEAYRRKVGDAIHEHAPGDIVYDWNYLGIARTSDILIVQFYKRIAANLAAAVGLRPQDAWINLVEVAKENWSFGEGVASYAPAEEQPA